MMRREKGGNVYRVQQSKNVPNEESLWIRGETVPVKSFPFTLRSVKAIASIDERSRRNCPWKLLLSNWMACNDGFFSRIYVGKEPVIWLLFKSKSSNVDSFDQSGNGPDTGPRGIINVVSLERKDISYGKVPARLFDFWPLGAEKQRWARGLYI